MFRIRRVYDDITEINKSALEQVRQIIREQFPGLSRRDINKIPRQLRDPLSFRFRAILFVAEGSKRKVKGFALLFHEPNLRFCYLDYLAAAGQRSGRGIGGALYERVRREALWLKSVGLFFECLPDDPALSRDPSIRRQNASRLRFYENYGARPIAGTTYETPLEPGDDNPPYLIFDALGQDQPLRREVARNIVRAILERKYAGVCPQEYVEMVIDSFRDDPVRLRPPRYKKSAPLPVNPEVPLDQRIALTVNDRHAIHHVQELGYVESPVRISTIIEAIEPTGLFETLTVRHFSERHIKAVHDAAFVEYLKKVCEKLPPDESLYPYVFPIRNAARPPRELPIRAGYYCIDTFTPINANAYLAARRAVDCALTLTEYILEGHRLAYALVRPPGHHAERRSFGGFCYFNSAAVSANYFSRHGKTSILDLDYHHGNGQQDIFYHRPDVLTVSIHGHPHFAYPYFSGFDDERGAEAGAGFNLNLPLPENIDSRRYRRALAQALRKIIRFKPRFLIVALGTDTARGDPTGSWPLDKDDFEIHGRMIGALHLPTLVVQEGGYDTKVLGQNVSGFLHGLWSGTYEV